MNPEDRPRSSDLVVDQDAHSNEMSKDYDTEPDNKHASHIPPLGGMNQLEKNPPRDPAALDYEQGDPEHEVQEGVRQMEAITQTWGKKSLAVVYVSMFLIYFVNAFRSSITANLGAYVVSGFEAHSLIPIIGVVSSVMSAACYMPIAKFLNLFDRSKGFLFMVALGTLGTILSATCTNIQMYCAAEVLSSIGFTGMTFSVDVLTTDTSSLLDRGLAFAFTSSPYIITAFAGPKASEHFYESNWRWGYGTWAIVLPIVAMPLYITLQINKNKAIKNGLLPRIPSGRTLKQSIWHYAIEFDVLGVFLLAGGLVVFLLPFNLAATFSDSWASPSIIAMLVVGFVLLLSFGLVEYYVAPKPFVPFGLLVSRTVLGTCFQDMTYQIAYYCWNSYFTSFLQVVFGTSIADAGYISSTFDVVSGVWLLGVGYLIRRTGYFRWLLFIAVPLYLLGAGLMIHFRKPGSGVGYVVMCQIFIAFAGGTMIICQQVAVLASASHNHAAAALALLGLFGNTGGAIGNSISGAIWTNTFPNALQRLLPEESVADWETIYESLDVQLSYEMGTATRDAIMAAYADAQSKMLIAGTCIMALSLGWMFVIRNIKVSEIEQVKGVLF